MSGKTSFASPWVTSAVQLNVSRENPPGIGARPSIAISQLLPKAFLNNSEIALSILLVTAPVGRSLFREGFWPLNEIIALHELFHSLVIGFHRFTKRRRIEAAIHHIFTCP